MQYQAGDCRAEHIYYNDVFEKETQTSDSTTLALKLLKIKKNKRRVLNMATFKTAKNRYFH